MELRTRDRSHMVDHDIDGYREGILVTQHRGCQRITDKNYINPGTVNDLRARSVVGSNHGKLRTMLASHNSWHSNFVFHSGSFFRFHEPEIRYPCVLRPLVTDSPVSHVPSACKLKLSIKRA